MAEPEEVLTVPLKSLGTAVSSGVAATGGGSGSGGRGGGRAKSPMDPTTQFYIDQSLKTFRAETKADINAVRGEMTLMETKLENALQTNTNRIETAIGHLPTVRSLTQAVVSAVVTVILAFIAIFGLAVAIFNAGNTAAGIGADRAADARQGVEKLDQVTKDQQGQISVIDQKLDRIVSILQPSTAEASK